MNDREIDLPSWQRRLVRAGLATVAVVLVASQSTRIFADDYRVALTVLACLTAAAAATAVSSAPWPVRIAVGVICTVGGAAAGLVGAGGKVADDLIHVPLDGLSEVLAAVWPSPAIPVGVGAVVGLSCLSAVAAVELVIRRSSTAALLPSLALTGLVAMLSAPAGAPPLWVLSAYVATALALLSTGEQHRRRSSIATVHAGLITAVAVMIPVMMAGTLTTARFDPRDRIEAPNVPETGISPLARLDEWRSFTPAVAVFSTTLPTVERWRLVGLTRYDGRTWLPADDFRRSSAQIGVAADGGAVVDVDVEIGALDAAWLPSIDDTIEVSEPVRVDGTRSGLLAEVPPVDGTTYQIAVQPVDVQPALLVGARAAPATSPFGAGFELSPDVLELASTITAGAGTDYDRAQAIATFLREQYVLDTDTPPGHSLAVLELFLQRTLRGRDEQFIAAYGLLAAAVGLPVRIAVGFDTTVDGNGTVAMSDQAVAWPEVDFGRFGWVEFDPVPGSSELLPPSPGDGAVAPIEDESVEPPPTTAATTTQTTLPEAVTADTVPPALDTSISRRAVGAGVSIGVVVLLLAAYAGLITMLKSRRRRRRRHAPTPRDQAVGAFKSGVDVLVDLGASAPRSATDRELVAVGARAVGEAALTLRPAAAAATQAVYSPDDPSPDDSERAWHTIAEFEAVTQARVGRWRYLRGKVSTRSLRRGLRD